MKKNTAHGKINTAKAFKYYLMGLTSKEIAKLLDCSFRTVQNYMSAENWKQKREILLNNKALE